MKKADGEKIMPTKEAKLNCACSKPIPTWIGVDVVCKRCMLPIEDRRLNITLEKIEGDPVSYLLKRAQSDSKIESRNDKP